MKIEVAPKHTLTFGQVPPGSTFVSVDDYYLKDKQGQPLIYLKLTDGNGVVDLNYGNLYAGEEFQCERLALVSTKLVVN